MSVFQWIGPRKIDGVKVEGRRPSRARAIVSRRLLGTWPFGRALKADLEMIVKAGGALIPASDVIVISDESESARLAVDLVASVAEKSLTMIQVSRLDAARDMLSPAKLPISRVDPRRVVIVTHPDWTHCGSASTFDLIGRVLNSMNVLPVFLALGPFRSKDEIRLGTNYSFQPSTAWHGLRWRLRTTALRSATQGAAWTLLDRSSLIGWYARRYKSVGLPPKLVRLIKALPVSAIYANHVFTLAFAERLAAISGARKARIVLDTHDLQTFNFAGQGFVLPIRLSQPDAAAELENEVRLIARADCALFVSDRERELFEQMAKALLIDMPETRTAFPLPGTVRQAKQTNESPSHSRAGILVMANNAANKAGLDWLADEVIPRLSEENLRIYAVGDILNYARSRSSLPDSLQFVGRVEEMDPWYRQACVAILPVVTGGGIAIKTLEALTYGLPVVATTHALRAIPEVDPLVGHDDAADFADEISRLLASPDYRLRVADAGQEALRRLEKARYEVVLPRIPALR